MITVSGGKGTGKEDAVIIDAPDEQAGINAEYGILSEIFGEEKRDWHFQSQRLIHDDKSGKSYDIMAIEVDGIEYDIWFDITLFHGKY